MRYWAYFAAKLAAAAAVLGSLLALINWSWPPLKPFLHDSSYLPPRFGYDLGYTLAIMVWFLLCHICIYFIIWDQRYRCRTCLRRLRMPVTTGSWSRMLQFGPPRTEYICPYGHGTLKEDQVRISGGENPEWTPHSDDLWEELCAASRDDKPIP
jgi:hypothetical protein